MYFCFINDNLENDIFQTISQLEFVNSQLEFVSSQLEVYRTSPVRFPAGFQEMSCTVSGRTFYYNVRSDIISK